MNPWERLCRCGHPMREHRLDWDDPLDGSQPDCRAVIPFEGADGEHRRCECMGFELRRAVRG